jgi:hypothetical protein
MKHILNVIHREPQNHWIVRPSSLLKRIAGWMEQKMVNKQQRACSQNRCAVTPHIMLEWCTLHGPLADFGCTG